METVAEMVRVANEVVVSFCQILAMLVITVGVGKSVFVYAADLFTKRKSLESISESRLEIGHSFSLALAFLIGGSILKTTLAPTWNDIGQLASIIAIRTALNYFLLRNIFTGDNGDGDR